MGENGRYTIAETLYESKTTVVRRAIRNTDNAAVVLKYLNKRYPNDSETAKFIREYEIANGIDEDGVVRMISTETIDDTVAIVMENCGGETIGDLLERERRIPIEFFLNLGLQMSAILEVIHRYGVIHRDINPSNIVWARESDRLTLIDFGISSLLKSENPRGVSATSIEGTLKYMSPEQTGRMNRAVDYRTDYYSLGVTFYEMLTGVVPFDSDDAMELVHSHIAKEPKPPHEIDTRIPKPVSDIVMKLMNKMAEGRYRSMYGLRVDLDWCREQAQRDGAIDLFQLGRKDISREFLVSQKLYGRSTELQALMDVYSETRKGENRTVFV